MSTTLGNMHLSGQIQSDVVVAVRKWYRVSYVWGSTPDSEHLSGFQEKEYRRIASGSSIDDALANARNAIRAEFSGHRSQGTTGVQGASRYCLISADNLTFTNIERIHE